RWMVITAALCSLAAAVEKQLKPGESELYNDVVKDLGTANFTKTLADLDAWQQKYPDSDFKDERSALYVQTYAGLNQPMKTIDVAGELIARDLNTVFPGPSGQATVIRILYNAAAAITQIANPSPAELAAG